MYSTKIKISQLNQMEFLKVLPIEIKRFLSKLNDSSPKFKGIKPLKGAKVTIAFPRRGCWLLIFALQANEMITERNQKKNCLWPDLATPMVDELEDDSGGMGRGLKERSAIHRDELVRVAVWDPDVTAGVWKPFCVRVHSQFELSAAFTFLVSRH